MINLVFADLPKRTVDALRAGSLGVALTVASVPFLLGTLMFVAAMMRGREVPTVPLVMYAVGAVPVAFRAFVPEVALDLGSSPSPSDRLARDLAVHQLQPHPDLVAGRPSPARPPIPA